MFTSGKQKEGQRQGEEQYLETDVDCERAQEENEGQATYSDAQTKILMPGSPYLWIFNPSSAQLFLNLAHSSCSSSKLL